MIMEDSWNCPLENPEYDGLTVRCQECEFYDPVYCDDLPEQ